MEASASPLAEMVFEVSFVSEALYAVDASPLPFEGPGEIRIEQDALHLLQGDKRITVSIQQVGNVLSDDLRLQFQIFSDPAAGVRSLLCVVEVLGDRIAFLQAALPSRLTPELKNRLEEDQRQAQEVGPLFDQRPGPAICVLLALNILVFVWMLMNGADLMRPTGKILIDSGSNFGPLTLSGDWWRLLSSAFIHIGLIHIGVNMLALWNLGRFLERAFGTPMFVIIYLGAALQGSMLSVFMNPMVNSAGASGAICGLGGALLAFCLRRRQELPSHLCKSLRNNALQFIGLTALIGFGVPGIDNFAHLGGFLGGLALGAIGSLPLDPAVRKAATSKRLSLLLVCAVLLVGATGFLLKSSGSAQVASFFKDFEKNEAKVLAARQAALEKLTAQQDQALRLAVAHELESECLPFLRELRSQSDRLAASGSAEAKKTMAKIHRYLVSREKEVQLRIEALRKDDLALWKQADEEVKQWIKKP